MIKLFFIGSTKVPYKRQDDGGASFTSLEALGRGIEINRTQMWWEGYLNSYACKKRNHCLPVLGF